MTNPKAVFKGKNYRISIISDMIIRLEYDEEGIEIPFNQLVVHMEQSEQVYVEVKSDDKTM